MKSYNKVPDDRDEISDVLCDICGKSCRDSDAMNFEYAKLTAHWGYNSRKDCEEHEADICEDCYDILIGLLKIKVRVKNYL